MKSNQKEHGTSRYDYGTGKISTGGQKTKAEKPMREPVVQRRVMPGDAQAAMKSGKC